MLFSDLARAVVELVDTEQVSWSPSAADVTGALGVARESGGGSRRGTLGGGSSVMRRLPTHLRLVSSEDVSWLVVNGLMSAVGTDASSRRFERESR